MCRPRFWAGPISGKMQINVDGQQVTQNSAGTDASASRITAPEAIDQFQIVTNRFDATMGRSSRMQVVVQTKSGTDQFHGSLFGYFRNERSTRPIQWRTRYCPSPIRFRRIGGRSDTQEQAVFLLSLEGERQPNTIFDSPTGFAGSHTSSRPSCAPIAICCAPTGRSTALIVYRSEAPGTPGATRSIT